MTMIQVHYIDIAMLNGVGTMGKKEDTVHIAQPQVMDIHIVMLKQKSIQVIVVGQNKQV